MISLRGIGRGVVRGLHELGQQIQRLTGKLGKRTVRQSTAPQAARLQTKPMPLAGAKRRKTLQIVAPTSPSSRPSRKDANKIDAFLKAAHPDIKRNQSTRQKIWRALLSPSPETSEGTSDSPQFLLPISSRASLSLKMHQLKRPEDADSLHRYKSALIMDGDWNLSVHRNKKDLPALLKEKLPARGTDAGADLQSSDRTLRVFVC